MDELPQRTLTVSRNHIYRYYVSEPGISCSPLLILHGWPDDAYLFSQVLPRCQSLNLRIAVPDLLGYEGTSKPTDPSLYNMRSMCEGLHEIINPENIARVIVIGHDWGSTLAST